MSSTEIYVKMAGCRKWELIGCARNAMAGAFKIWLEMEKKYLPHWKGTITEVWVCVQKKRKKNCGIFRAIKVTR